MAGKLEHSTVILGCTAVNGTTIESEHTGTEHTNTTG